jgi:hypothetical protein
MRLLHVCWWQVISIEDRQLNVTEQHSRLAGSSLLNNQAACAEALIAALLRNRTAALILTFCPQLPCHGCVEHACQRLRVQTQVAVACCCCT